MDNYKTWKEVPKNAIEQLHQLVTATWDGNLIHKGWADKLVKLGYVNYHDGWRVVSTEGLKVLKDFGMLRS